MGAQRPVEPVLLDVAGPQLEDQRAHLGKRFALEVAQLGQLGPRRVRIAVEQQLDAACNERHREQRLGDGVVELPGEVCALLARCQLAGLAAQLPLEAFALADVADRALPADEPAILGQADRGDLRAERRSVRAGGAW